MLLLCFWFLGLFAFFKNKKKDCKVFKKDVNEFFVWFFFGGGDVIFSPEVGCEPMSRELARFVSKLHRHFSVCSETETSRTSFASQQDRYII